MSALLLTSDLLFSSRVAGAAGRVGVQLQTVSAADLDRIGQLLDDGAVQLVIIDLDATDLSLSTILDKLSERPTPRPTIVAYGAHVRRQRLAEAREAGCDEVLTRGQFDAEMDEILRRRCS